jgi:hypothetical protein
MATDTSVTRWSLWSYARGEVGDLEMPGGSTMERWPPVELRPTAVREGWMVPVEGDWPGRSELERWLRGADVGGRASRGLLAAFERWSSVVWMMNGADSLAWLRSRELGLERARRMRLVGPNVSSLWESMQTVLEPLEPRDPRAVLIVLRASRGTGRRAGSPDLDALAGVPPRRVRERAERLRDEVRRLFGCEVDRVGAPDAVAPFRIGLGAPTGRPGRPSGAGGAEVPFPSPGARAPELREDSPW